MVIFFVLTRQFSLYLHFHTLSRGSAPFCNKDTTFGNLKRVNSDKYHSQSKNVLNKPRLSFPSQIEGTKKLLNKDLGELINKMRLAQQNAITSLKEECQRQMLAAAHTLALDSKNLLDAVDQARVRANLAKPKPDSEEGDGSAE